MSKIFGYAGYGAFSVALMATLSSIFISEVLHQPPCVLCWYQRILMYPLVIIIGVGIIRRDSNWPIMALISAGIGWLVALYHSLLMWGVISETLAPCTGGVSCVEGTTNWIGPMPIPFLSFLAFTAILIGTYIVWKGNKSEQRV